MAIEPENSLCIVKIFARKHVLNFFFATIIATKIIVLQQFQVYNLYFLDLFKERNLNETHIISDLTITFGLMVEIPSKCYYSSLDTKCMKTGETTDVQIKKS